MIFSFSLNVDKWLSENFPLGTHLREKGSWRERDRNGNDEEREASDNKY